jgi:hypothetical protein
MSGPTNITREAVEETPFGCGIRLEGDRPVVERDRARIQGLVRRTANRQAARPGEQLTICVDGGLLAEITPGKLSWEEIRNGRLVDVQA